MSVDKEEELTLDQVMKRGAKNGYKLYLKIQNIASLSSYTPAENIISYGLCAAGVFRSVVNNARKDNENPEPMEEQVFRNVMSLFAEAFGFGLSLDMKMAKGDEETDRLIKNLQKSIGDAPQ